jgi:hypothetical protein
VYRAAMRRPEIIAAILLGIGLGGFGAAYLLYQSRAQMLVERPAATGDVGSVAVYAQFPSGPVRLQPGRRRIVPRPQDIAFQVTAAGTGPRIVRIEMIAGARRTVMHEEKLEAPMDRESLGYVLRLGDDAPDEVELAIVIEAPHTIGYEAKYPLVLQK